jgi:Mor family transcriptional regulator
MDLHDIEQLEPIYKDIYQLLLEALGPLHAIELIAERMGGSTVTFPRRKYQALKRQAEIKSLWDKGLSVRDMAKITGMTERNVYYVLTMLQLKPRVSIYELCGTEWGASVPRDIAKKAKI